VPYPHDPHPFGPHFHCCHPVVTLLSLCLSLSLKDIQVFKKYPIESDFFGKGFFGKKRRGEKKNEKNEKAFAGSL
jgi:hypothetical protein